MRQSLRQVRSASFEFSAIMDLTAHGDSSEDVDRQAGASLDIRVSEAMIRAGAAVLADEAGVCGASLAEELAALVFMAMMGACRNSLSVRHEEDSRRAT
jgi:hypothetical protein